MSVISFFSGEYCREQSVVEAVHGTTGLSIVRDAELVADAAKLSGLGADKIEKAFEAKTSVFNTFTHEKQRAAAWLRLALASRLAETTDLLVAGFCALLPPRSIPHVLRVCLIGDAAFRRGVAAEEAGLSEREAQRALEHADENRAAWASWWPTPRILGPQPQPFSCPWTRPASDAACDAILKFCSTCLRHRGPPRRRP